jgi:hypothetical protein
VEARALQIWGPLHLQPRRDHRQDSPAGQLSFSSSFFLLPFFSFLFLSRIFVWYGSFFCPLLFPVFSSFFIPFFSPIPFIPPPFSLFSLLVSFCSVLFFRTHLSLLSFYLSSLFSIFICISVLFCSSRSLFLFHFHSVILYSLFCFSSLALFRLCPFSLFDLSYSLFLPVLWIRIRDPGLGAFLTRGSGIRDG